MSWNVLFVDQFCPCHTPLGSSYQNWYSGVPLGSTAVAVKVTVSPGLAFPLLALLDSVTLWTDGPLEA
ncbi:MAG: hypothetical protein K6V97_13480 [Actinomycetia bacterium]|nr:hypothetical protein [Actinomycetes bacterium]